MPVRLFAFFGVDEQMIYAIIGEQKFGEQNANIEKKEGRSGMAFSCVMRMKEECDGCMRCMREGRSEAQEDEA